VRVLPLGPLDPEASELLVRELIGDGDGLAELRALVCERAAGNPFFAEEIAQSLFEQGVLARERGGTRLVREVREIAIPPTLTALLTARIDSLPADGKRALQVAAVIGPRFDEAELRSALRDEPLDLDEALRGLERADLVARDGKARLAFKHPLTQEVAYLSQLEEVRRARHQTVARTLLALHATRLGEHAPALAHHFAAGGLVHEARRWRGLSTLHVTNIQLRRERTLKPRGRIG
jgi:adenylate cyclase